jgi:hypothetical protein
MANLDPRVLPEPESDGGNYDLRAWNLHYEPTTSTFLVNLASDAAASTNGLIRPTLHAIGCSTLKDSDTTEWPTVDRRLLFALWSEERASQPLRRIWFCERSVMRQA